MLEARLQQAKLLKSVLEAIKDLVNDANFDCSDTGISLQAMDTAHVALVALQLRANGFDQYRCDRNLSLGINLGTFNKIFKCAGNDDIVTLKAEDNADLLSMAFESRNSDRLSEYQLRLMDIDAEHLGIPDTCYDATIRMSANEFRRICNDLNALGTESVAIDCSKEGVRFLANGDIGSGSITLKQHLAVNDDEVATTIDLNQNVNLTFSLKYLNNFSKASPLAKEVILGMSDGIPLLVEYKLEDLGYIRYYLAPKMGDEE